MALGISSNCVYYCLTHARFLTLLQFTDNDNIHPLQCAPNSFVSVGYYCTFSFTQHACKCAHTDHNKIGKRIASPSQLPYIIVISTASHPFYLRKRRYNLIRRIIGTISWPADSERGPRRKRGYPSSWISGFDCCRFICNKVRG